jgi:L-seryl-tRNA(Ser) seleniumtransferase
MIAAQPDALRARAERLAAALRSDTEDSRMAISVVGCESAVGGGSLPGETLPSYAVGLHGTQPDILARALRQATPPVIGRVVEGRLQLDVRTVLEEQDTALVVAVRDVMHEQSAESVVRET